MESYSIYLFFNWLISLCIIQVGGCDRISCLFKSEEYSCVCVCVCVWESVSDIKKSIHLSTDIWVASNPSLLWITLQWTCVCKSLFKTFLSVLLDIYPRVRFLDHGHSIFIFWGSVVLFSIVTAPLYSPTPKRSSFSESLPTLEIFCFFFFFW